MNSWLAPAFLSAVSKAANQTVTKGLLRSHGVMETSALGQIVAALILLPLALWPGLVRLPPPGPFHQAAWVTVLLNATAIIMLTAAIKGSGLSYALPFLGLTPVFIIMTGRLIRGESVSVPGMAGIALVAAGALGVDATSLKDWVTLGGARALKEKDVWIVITVAFIWAVSSVYDKTATLLSDPLTFVWYSAQCRAGLILVMLCLWRRFRLHGDDCLQGVKLPRDPWLWLLAGGTFVLEAIFQMGALRTGMVAYVLAVKRTSILISSTAGIYLFGEKFTRQRLIGAVVMVLGTAVIALA